MRKTLSVLALLAGCGLLAASALASARQAPPGDTFRWSLSVDVDYVDPALAYYRPSWALEYATGAMLLNYPDAPAPRGSRLEPEVAAGFPTISPDGRTYTFRLKKTYRFSNGHEVRAAHFVRAITRAGHQRMRSPARSFLDDVKWARALGPHTLRIRTTQRAPDLLARLAMPFFMAIPVNTPLDPEGIGAPVVSAGPYFIREWTHRRRITLQRNRYYRGPRPHRVDWIVADIGLPLETIKLNIDRGNTDTGDIPPAAHADLGRRYGVKRRSPGRYFANPAPTILYFALNHDRPLLGGPTRLGNVPLKRAINLAIDRTIIVQQYGAFAGTAHDRILPPTMPGVRNAGIYPRRPDLARARALAAGNTRSGKAVLYCANRAPAPQVCQIVQAQLRPIGLELDIKLFPGCCRERDRRGDPYDLTIRSWSVAYFDPYHFFLVVDGRTIRPADSPNVSYFNSPRYNARIARARTLTGLERYEEFAALDREVMQKVAPVAVYSAQNERQYVSTRTGCYHHHPVYGLDLPAVCLRR